MRKIVWLWGMLSALFACGFAAPALAGASLSYRTLPGWDGTPVGAVVMTPTGQGPGPFPLIVMPASWALPSLEYVGRGTVLANQGYVVVSYTSRGFWESGGRIDVAGPATVEDVSAVIDWALANTPARADAIGVSGISYGAGTSLLAAARDPRVKAVAALSGWADLEASLYPYRTPNKQAMALLIASGYFTGRPGPELARAAEYAVWGDYEGAVRVTLPIVGNRGVQNEVAALNRNGTAVLLANAWNDGIFAPNQLVRLFEGLTGPKRLMFAPGDHATIELPGALGLPNEVYDQAGRWFDFHLKRIDNGVGREPTVRLRSQAQGLRTFPSWSAVQATPTVFGLTRPSGLLVPTGDLSGGTSTGWSHGIASGVPTIADSGTVLLSGLMQGLGVQTTTSIPLVARGAAVVWQGPWLSAPRNLSGKPSLRITLSPSRSEVSVFAYLYSVDGLGIGQLITHKAYTLRDAMPYAARTIDIEMEATSWDIPAGRRLALVVDTTDPRYTDASGLGSVHVSSPASAPSQLRLPLR
jgi:predicted acyl esterase